ncbi:MAG TPA: hypothetical protein VFI02_02860, partial [Armatimonadota bacterium]|nr:hypothetical protein [Armatimonadota bacterium]
GIAVYNSRAGAEDAAATEIASIDLGDWPKEEVIPIASVIYHHGAAMSNGVEAAIQSTVGGADFIDWRFTAISGSSTSVNDHGALSGLSDDDHVQYLLASDATDRATFATNWLDLTDAGDTALHIHDSRYYTETEIDIDLAAYLPLAGGNMTGNLFLDNASPALQLRPSGSVTGYGHLLSGATETQLRQWSTTSADIHLSPMGNGVGFYSNVMLFRYSNSQYSQFLMHLGDGTGTVQHTFRGDSGDISLCQQGGNLTVEEGNLYLDKTVDPTLFLREGGSANDYGAIIAPDAAQIQVRHYRASGDSFIAFDPMPLSGTDDAEFRMFRSTNTTGNVRFQMFVGDGTSSVQHLIRGDDGVVTLCQQAGGLVVSNGYVQLPYLGSAPGSPVNGMIWMESDGLHIYYAGAEKLVAGV